MRWAEEDSYDVTLYQERLSSWISTQSDEDLRRLFDDGILGNLAQALGLSGRGTFRELLKRIRRATDRSKEE